jgi:hypothetical protein
MPSQALKHLADMRHIPMEKAHHLWDKAKEIVSKEYGSEKNVKGYWALVMGITKKMMGMHEGLTFKEFLLAEAIELADTSNEESIGWYIVLEKNDTCAWGPFETYSKAVSALANHAGYAPHGVPADKLVYIEHGWCGDQNEFNELEE